MRSVVGKNDSFFIIASKANRCLPLILVIWILVTLYTILYVLKNNQNEKESSDLLIKAQKDLLELEKRYHQLEKLVTKQKPNLIKNDTIYNIPNFEYEWIRRRVVHDVEEFWYFINSKVTNLKYSTRKNWTFNINKILSMGFEYKRSIVNSMEKLKQVDGFNEWRTNEIANLSNIVQERLRYLQNPVDCKIRKKLMCTINYQCGFGCQMHHLVSCMVLAYGLQRTLILKSKGWQYHKEGWEDIFMPLSNNCTNVDNVSTDTWPGYNDSEVIHVPSQVSILPRPIFLPLAVPEDLLYRLNKIHGNPIVWWIGQILKYVWKPQKKTETYIKDKIEQLGIKSPFVGVHIRRTDKIGSEAAYHSIEEYMIKVNEYFDITRRKTNDTKRRVYIATDDFAVITEAKSKYPNYEIFYNQNLPKIPNSNFRHTNDKILDVILDIHILSHSSFLVCTFSSNICRLAYEFMQNDYVDASSKFSSLDDVYYYSQQEYNKRKVILNHKAESPHEIDLLQGDIIHIAGNHWDGYSLGTNLRTNEKGLYPSFKVEIESESVKFPTYSEINGR